MIASVKNKGVLVVSRIGRRLLGSVVSLCTVLLAFGTAIAAPRQEVEESVRLAFQERAQALFRGGDGSHLAEYYDVAYAQGGAVAGARLLTYERDKIAEFHRYLDERKMKVIAHEVELRFERVTASRGIAHATVTERTGFRWVYWDKPHQPNATGLGSHHDLDLVSKDGRWLIRRDDYLDSLRAWLKSDHRTPRG
jgi:hypothetical protein